MIAGTSCDNSYAHPKIQAKKDKTPVVTATTRGIRSVMLVVQDCWSALQRSMSRFRKALMMSIERVMVEIEAMSCENVSGGSWGVNVRVLPGCHRLCRWVR